MKNLNLIFMITSVIVPYQLSGTHRISANRGIIGSSIKYGNSVLVKVTALSMATAITYIAVATALMIMDIFCCHLFYAQLLFT
ncbi:hypothetical protein EGW07_25820 [Citrobacter amalonaticus]|nr:hypothetical protein EGW07_25820 [Citrobacter amalonaticus]